MKMTIIRIGLASIVIVLGLEGSGQAQPRCEDAPRMEALEKVLREGQIIGVEKEKLGGRTGPWLITLEAGPIKQRAIFRYVDRLRPHPTPDSYKYDLAAYILNRLLGIELVPPVIEREVEGRQGSLQVFLENCIREKDRKRKKLMPPDARAFSRALEEVRVFENLTYDECQDADDLYVHLNDWKVCRVDFSEAFAPVPELLPSCEITVCSRALYQGLLQWDKEAVKSKLGPYLNDKEIGAFFVRRDLIIEKLRALIAEKGEDSVLF